MYCSHTCNYKASPAVVLLRFLTLCFGYRVYFFLQYNLYGISCIKALFITPQVKIFLLRYERMPNDFMTLELPSSLDHSSQYVQVISSANRTASSVFTTLSRYLFQRRWVWSVQNSSSIQITTQAIGRILSTITKQVFLSTLTL